MSSFRLQIVTPEGALFDGDAEAVLVRTTEGYISIRAGHADYVAALDVGHITVTQNGKAREAACGGGFLSVEKGVCRLVATTFEYSETIDKERAENAKKRAEQKLSDAKTAKDIELAKAKLLRSMNRIEVAGK